MILLSACFQMQSLLYVGVNGDRVLYLSPLHIFPQVIVTS